jgi:glycosyltransferase involved in cell wall biosynthesis
MGRVLLEAGAAGVPSVATSVGGVPDIVRDGCTGLLIPPRDPIKLAEAVCALARDPARRRQLGDAARDAVVPHFGLERMVRRIESLYEELIREKHVER